MYVPESPDRIWYRLAGTGPSYENAAETDAKFWLIDEGEQYSLHPPHIEFDVRGAMHPVPV
jgi:hypothetical protein